MLVLPQFTKGWARACSTSGGSVSLGTARGRRGRHGRRGGGGGGAGGVRGPGAGRLRAGPPGGRAPERGRDPVDDRARGAARDLVPPLAGERGRGPAVHRLGAGRGRRLRGRGRRGDDGRRRDHGARRGGRRGRALARRRGAQLERGRGLVRARRGRGLGVRPGDGREHARERLPLCAAAPERAGLGVGARGLRHGRAHTDREERHGRDAARTRRTSGATRPISA